MIHRLPNYYRKSRVVKDLYMVVQKLLDKVSEDIAVEDLKLFITTTDDFALHEKDVGLPEVIADNETKRARVIARLQGNRLLTKPEFEDLIWIYDKTGCTVTEDFANYTVTILFSGRTGIPYNLEQIKEAVEEVKPAHIQINYAFLHNTWGDVKRKLGIWNDAKTLTWGNAQNYDGRTWLYVVNSKVYLRENGANAYVVFKNDEPYAHLL
jgi:hypothetical protein|nr:MAG TPA: tail protein [Caudoviricetes sp.]